MKTMEYWFESQESSPNWMLCVAIEQDGKRDIELLYSAVPKAEAITWYVEPGGTHMLVWQGTQMLASYKAKWQVTLPHPSKEQGVKHTLHDGETTAGHYQLVVPLDNPNDIQIGGSHYKGASFQPWDWELKGVSGWMQAVIKYVVRFDKKDGKKDLDKAIHYVDKALYHFKRGEHRSRATFTPGDVEKFLKQNNVEDESARWAVQYAVGWATEEDLLTLRGHIKTLSKEHFTF